MSLLVDSHRAPTPWRSLSAVLVLALLVRLIYVWLQVNYAFFSVALRAPDSERYISLAKNLLASGFYSMNGINPSAGDMPGYPLFLAGFMALFGQNLVVLYFLQAILSAATVWLVYLLAREVYSPQAGTWAALIAALNPLGFIFCASPLSEILYTFWGVLFLALYVRCPRHWAYGLGAGLAGGAAVLTRPILAGFIGLLCLVGWSKRGKRESATLIFIGLMIFILPWTARNWLAFGEFIPLADRGGFEFYLGNAQGATGGTGGHLIWGVDVQMPGSKPPDMSQNQWSQELMARALDDILDDPTRLITLAPKKIWNMWRPTYGDASLRNWIFLAGMYLLIWGLAIYSFTDWDLRKQSKLLWGYFLYHLAVHAVVFGILRYRVPVEPALIALAGAGLARLLGARKGRY